MKNVAQLSFRFTFPLIAGDVADSRNRYSWQVQSLAARHRLPIRHAAVYAEQMGVPVTEAPHV